MSQAHENNPPLDLNLLSTKNFKSRSDESKAICGGFFNQSKHAKITIRSILLGQFLSLLIAGTGVFTTELKNGGINFPAFQICFTYLVLFGCILLRKKKELRISWWKYGLLAILDVEANYLVVMAYKYTSITSVMLLDCFTIPAAMIMSKVFLNAQYRGLHVVGAVCSICGLVLTVLSDIWQNRMSEDSSYPHAILGDMLCLIGAVLYASMNVLEEAVVKRCSRLEFLGMIGGWGFFLSLIQAVILERAAFSSLTPWDTFNIGYLVGFTVCMVCMYSLTAVFLQVSDSAMFNISLLTSDIYAVVFAVVAYKQGVNWLYSVSFFVTLVGLLIYSNQPLATAHLCSKDNEEVLDLMSDELSNADPWDTRLDPEAVFYNSKEEHFVNGKDANNASQKQLLSLTSDDDSKETENGYSI